MGCRCLCFVLISCRLTLFSVFFVVVGWAGFFVVRRGHFGSSHFLLEIRICDLLAVDEFVLVCLCCVRFCRDPGECPSLLS